MKFGPVPPADALGAVLAHSFRLPSGARLIKGTRLESAHVAQLVSEGVSEVVVCRLGEGDIDENTAAARLAEYICGPGVQRSEPSTGRCNVVSETGGLVHIDVDGIHAINSIHESVTVSTLEPGTPVGEGALIATVKVIPFSVPEAALEECLRLAPETVGVDPFVPHRAALIQTRVEGTAARLLDRSERVLRSRLAERGSTLERAVVCAHTEESVAEALLGVLDEGVELVLVLGASATVDRRDVVPSAIAKAGGEVLHFGIPIDPGNLTLLAMHDETPVLGVPGCARAPRRNGFDTVLERILTGDIPSSLELSALGVGGLWKEGPGRPQPRLERSKPSARKKRVGGVILAAGQSERMGPQNKLLAMLDDRPLVRHVVETAVGSGLETVTVVLGHEGERVRDALRGLDVRFVENADWREGMGTSVAAGIGSLPEGLDGVVIALGDMPWVSETAVGALLESFDPTAGAGICVPVRDRKRGNPVLWAQRYFARLEALTGDVGARVLMAEFADDLTEVEVEGEGVLLDVDTPEALAEAREGLSD